MKGNTKQHQSVHCSTRQKSRHVEDLFTRAKEEVHQVLIHLVDVMEIGKFRKNTTKLDIGWPKSGTVIARICFEWCQGKRLFIYQVVGTKPSQPKQVKGVTSSRWYRGVRAKPMRSQYQNRVRLHFSNLLNLEFFLGEGELNKYQDFNHPNMFSTYVFLPLLFLQRFFLQRTTEPFALAFSRRTTWMSSVVVGQPPSRPLPGSPRRNTPLGRSRVVTGRWEVPRLLQEPVEFCEMHFSHQFMSVFFGSFEPFRLTEEKEFQAGSDRVVFPHLGPKNRSLWWQPPHRWPGSVTRSWPRWVTLKIKARCLFGLWWWWWWWWCWKPAQQKGTVRWLSWFFEHFFFDDLYRVVKLKTRKQGFEINVFWFDSICLIVMGRSSSFLVLGQQLAENRLGHPRGRLLALDAGRHLPLDHPHRAEVCPGAVGWWIVVAEEWSVPNSSTAFCKKSLKKTKEM